jgi:hypothetical protein
MPRSAILEVTMNNHRSQQPNVMSSKRSFSTIKIQSTAEQDLQSLGGGGEAFRARPVTGECIMHIADIKKTSFTCDGTTHCGTGEQSKVECMQGREVSRKPCGGARYFYYPAMRLM